MPVVPFKGPHPLGEGVQVHFGNVVPPPGWGNRRPAKGATNSDKATSTGPLPKR